MSDLATDLPAPAARPFASTGPTGHRSRMRDKLLGAGQEALADYEVLEMLLFLGIPRRDTKPLAKAMINRFGTLDGVLRADPVVLRDAFRLGEDCLTVLRLPAEAAQRLARAEDRLHPILNNWDKLLTYFDTALAGAPENELRVLFLDNRNRLLADEVAGGADEAGGGPDGRPRAILTRALALHSTALILVRTRAKTTPAALRAEAVLTLGLRKAAGLLSIVVHDHMLGQGGQWSSLRQKGLI